MFTRVLIANRGEIAVRIARTCRALGIPTAAVFSDADRNARHVVAADSALHIGPAPASESYLSVGRVIDAARQVLDCMEHQPEIRLCNDMPTGPMNRVADPSLAERLLGWSPRVRFADGLRTTIDWYVRAHRRDEVSARLPHLLTER